MESNEQTELTSKIDSESRLTARGVGEVWRGWRYWAKKKKELIDTDDRLLYSGEEGGWRWRKVAGINNNGKNKIRKRKPVYS